MSVFFYVLVVLIAIAMPFLIFAIVIRRLLGKSNKRIGKLSWILVVSMMVFAVLGGLVDPATWCEHEYKIVGEIQPTCSNRGEIRECCDKCKREVITTKDKLKHSWKTTSEVESTCIANGKIVEQCELCGEERIFETEKLKHDYDIVETIGATCTTEGVVIKKCIVCGKENSKKEAKLEHDLKIKNVVEATCENNGYTEYQCLACGYIEKKAEKKALGHKMEEVSRKEPTYSENGKIIFKCIRCDESKTENIDMLKIDTVKFSGFELDFGQYTFTKVDNRFSEHFMKKVVKIPITIKNISNEPYSLTALYYQVFDSSGVESENVGYYFQDDICHLGQILPNTSVTRYFHILYDDDGTYTIVLDDWLFDKEMVEIQVRS